MPDIVPNWHPAAVHFPIALGITAALLLLVARLTPRSAGAEQAGRLLLALAAGSAIVAAGLGWQAFATVEHDAAGHAVMLRHRDWALGCTGALLLIALWDAARLRAGRRPHGFLLPAMVVLSGCLAMTGWLGGEMVYRHAIGVTLPPAVVSEPAAPAAAPVVPVAPAGQAATVESPSAQPEHVHRDGKRHRH